MIQESILDKILYNVKKLIPRSVFNFFQPAYHAILAYAGALLYGFPSKKLKVIGVTGTKGKSTVVYLISRLFESSGKKIAACGSLGFKIKNKEWPNTLKMTMPGRFRLQKLMAEAVRAGCEYFVLEVTSEGIKQKRHLGINFDCAVFTNLHKEHIESHGSFEKYYQAKQELFKRTDNIHVINADDVNFELFSKFHSQKTIFFGLKKGDIIASNLKLTSEGASFEVYGTNFNTHLAGEFNVSNCLAALAVGVMYGLDLPSMKPAIESVKHIPGRMEFIQREPFNVVVDYAHTPDSLEAVYKSLKSQITNHKSQINSKFQIPNPKSEATALLRYPANRLICVLGAAGGGRDKWKRPEFGRIAEKYCDQIILTDEDPYDENPTQILSEIKSGITNYQFPITNILDRREAIKKALSSAQAGDTVIITGKGSETSMAVAENKKIPWSDKKVIQELLTSKQS
ncbi:MAG: UDP-N-acetylmuramoyl-L-alanyl-D-glutamate--2,6-diaminopimelate ligase [Candidatus Taylorbacteria bacterium]|nr:UDP-N-acetylmuramoyl-L-alanyl-D-glutamate--2,6-diaminopimelate ligase [Candidatus Taylorbacteria bacterium]